MKLLSLVFLTLLAWSQMVVGDHLTDMPLSMFRDGEFRIVGYALFALLLAIGAIMVAALRRANRAADAAVFAFVLALLMVVVATPSLNAWHEAGAALLLLTLFGYYAGRLVLARSSLLYFHLVMPLALTPLVGLGYGPWQKGIIVYLLLLINIHWHLFERNASQSRLPAGSAAAQRRRVVYVVEAGQAWRRRRRLGSTSCVN